MAPSKAEDDLDAALASVTEVQISGDLQVAKVYVSISGSGEGQEAAMQGLTRLKGCIARSIYLLCHQHLGQLQIVSKVLQSPVYVRHPSPLYHAVLLWP